MEVRDTRPRLRASLDGNDSFLSGGHGVIKTAGATRHAERMAKVPVWALDDEKIIQLIRIRFPKADTDQNQRRLAARMVRLIHLYYREGSTAAQVAEALKMSVGMVYKIAHRLEKDMAKPLMPIGRPRKGVHIQTTNGSTGEDHKPL